MSYNSRSPAVKRLMKEAQELAEPTELYAAHPLEDNLFEWHFTIRGPEDTPFHGGIYHGRILLPSEYPMKPPNILLLTPNGRFEVKRKICLSISGYHPESWRPCWSIRTALLAIIGFMPTHGGGAIGSLEFPDEERKKLSKASLDFICPDCGPIRNILLPQTEASIKDREEAKTLASQIDFQGEKAKGSSSAAPNADAAAPAPAPAVDPAPIAAPTAEAVAASVPAPSSFAVPSGGAEVGVPPVPQWPPYYQYYPYYPFFPPITNNGQMQLMGPSAEPLSFEQWLVQVKAGSGATTAPEAAKTAAAPSVPTAPSTESSEPESKLRHRKASPEPAAEEPKAEESANQVEAEEEEEEKVAPVAAEVMEEEVLVTPTDPSDEWPMLSVFVICLLLLLVLLANRFLLPPIFELFGGTRQ